MKDCRLEFIYLKFEIIHTAPLKSKNGTDLGGISNQYLILSIYHKQAINMGGPKMGALGVTVRRHIYFSLSPFEQAAYYGMGQGAANVGRRIGSNVLYVGPRKYYVKY